MNYEQITGEGQPMEEDENVDPIWTSSRTARQIYALTMVEKVLMFILLIMNLQLNTDTTYLGYQQTISTCSFFSIFTYLATD